MGGASQIIYKLPYYNNMMDYINENNIWYAVYPESVAQLIGYDMDGFEVYSDDTLIEEGFEVEVNAMDALEMWEFGEEFYNYKLKEND